VGETEDMLLFLTLNPVLALLSNYDRENCLINVGTEGGKTGVSGFTEKLPINRRFRLSTAAVVSSP
jgi:hypothetical protein